MAEHIRRGACLLFRVLYCRTRRLELRNGIFYVAKRPVLKAKTIHFETLNGSFRKLIQLVLQIMGGHAVVHGVPECVIEWWFAVAVMAPVGVITASLFIRFSAWLANKGARGGWGKDDG